MAIRAQAIRRQLTLFVPGDAAGELESLRRLLDPEQARLIPAHVTLCREDELGPLNEAQARRRLLNDPLKPVTLRFGRPEAFSGHGILLPCIAGESAFRRLREHLLGTAEIRAQRPHITLAHPRNPKSPGNSLGNAWRLPDVLSITFPTVSLIEQEGNEPWTLLQTFDLPG